MFREFTEKGQHDLITMTRTHTHKVAQGNLHANSKVCEVPQGFSLGFTASPLAIIVIVPINKNKKTPSCWSCFGALPLLPIANLPNITENSTDMCICKFTSHIMFD